MLHAFLISPILCSTYFLDFIILIYFMKSINFLYTVQFMAALNTVVHTLSNLQ
jgi:hypothetical protein